MRHESESERRESHNATEQRRRLKINRNIQDLQELIPSSGDNSNNKAAVLQAAVDYISQLKDMCSSIAKQNEQLEVENFQMEEDIASIVSDNDSNGKREMLPHSSSAFDRPSRNKPGEGGERDFIFSLPIPIPTRSGSSSGSTSPSSYSLSISPSPGTSPTHPDYFNNRSASSNSNTNSNTNSNVSTPSTSPNQQHVFTVPSQQQQQPHQQNNGNHSGPTTTTTTTTTTSHNPCNTTTTTTTQTNLPPHYSHGSDSRGGFGLNRILNQTNEIPSDASSSLSSSSSSSASSS